MARKYTVVYLQHGDLCFNTFNSREELVGWLEANPDLPAISVSAGGEHIVEDHT